STPRTVPGGRARLRELPLLPKHVGVTWPAPGVIEEPVRLRGVARYDARRRSSKPPKDARRGAGTQAAFQSHGRLERGAAAVRPRRGKLRPALRRLAPVLRVGWGGARYAAALPLG